MKFVFSFVALVCANLYFCQAANTSGNQKVCASPCAPININVHGNQGIKGDKGERGDSGSKGDKGKPCRCSLQDTNKPSAHMEAANKITVTYQANTVVKDWSVSAPHSYVAGGMKYQNGKLTVPISGRYYIYAQIYYVSPTGRVAFHVNNKRITMIHSSISGTGAVTLYAGGVFNLKAGDYITLFVEYTIKLYMWSDHSYFGAFLI